MLPKTSKAQSELALFQLLTPLLTVRNMVLLLQSLKHSQLQLLSNLRDSSSVHEKKDAYIEHSREMMMIFKT